MELASMFKILSLDFSNHYIKARISFNKNHSVFGGHFPGNPVVPGVVHVQIIKNILESVLHKMIFLNRVKSIKFINFLNPFEVEVVNFEIEFGPLQLEHDISVKCVVKTETLIYMKYSGKALVSDKE